MRLVVTLIDDGFERSHVSPYFLPESASLADLQAAAAEIVARLHAERKRYTHGANGGTVSVSDLPLILSELMQAVQMFVRERCDAEPVDPAKLEAQWNALAAIVAAALPIDYQTKRGAA